MGLSCRAWTGSQISLLFGLEGLVQDCFQLAFGFKGLRLNSCPQTGLSVLSQAPQGLLRDGEGLIGIPSRGAWSVGLYLYRLL